MACKLAQTTGQYTETGSSLIAQVARKLIQSTGFYIETGASLTAQVTRKLSLVTGQYVFSGISAVLTYVPGGVKQFYTLLANSGSYIETGPGLVAKATRKLALTHRSLYGDRF